MIDDLTKPLPPELRPSDHAVGSFARFMLASMATRPGYEGTASEIKTAKRRAKNKVARRSRRINRRH